ncbi:MAG TPA: class I SAM-dependent methyltransferase [Sphingomonadaceae bacterium]|nr:class I SAM-dependent methyltransferase [Sphingomonadaceae bacterium]
MTSREATGLFPRAADARRRTAADWAWQLGLGAITWPWLLRSLRGGSKAAKRALLTRLHLPQDALPNLGSWKADTGLLTLIVDHVEAHRPRTVVEFGSGATSLIIAQALKLHGGGRLFSFDQHAEFVGATAAWLGTHGLDADMRHAPLGDPAPGWPGRWYDPGALPDAIDLLVVDGPPWTIHPLTRGSAESVFGRLAAGGTIMLDDAARPGERIVARWWRRRWPDITFQLVHAGTKGTLVGRRRP